MWGEPILGIRLRAHYPHYPYPLAHHQGLVCNSWGTVNVVAVQSRCIASPGFVKRGYNVSMVLWNPPAAPVPRDDRNRLLKTLNAVGRLSTGQLLNFRLRVD